MSDIFIMFFFSSRRRHTRLVSDWSSDVCSSDLRTRGGPGTGEERGVGAADGPRADVEDPVARFAAVPDGTGLPAGQPDDSVGPRRRGQRRRARDAHPHQADAVTRLATLGSGAV